MQSLGPHGNRIQPHSFPSLGPCLEEALCWVLPPGTGVRRGLVGELLPPVLVLSIAHKLVQGSLQGTKAP